jgi:predicted N-formylglutamate amidohydrolase
MAATGYRRATRRCFAADARGSRALARLLARGLKASLHVGKFSRLLVDLNRSAHHRAVFSVVSREFDVSEKRNILARYYFPYRKAVEAEIARHTAAGRFVLHLSVHSFTPVLGGVERSADIGLLYDPTRREEQKYCARVSSTLRRIDPALRVRRNYPYRGTADGFTTHLRRRFPGNRYAGIELEVNQRYPRRGGGRWRRLQASILAVWRDAVRDGRRRGRVPKDQ